MIAEPYDEADAFPGTWTIDPAASHLSFTVHYALAGRIRGRFTDFEGLLGLDPDITRCSAMLLITAASVQTGPPGQDQWLRSDAFLDTDTYPYIWFQSTRVAPHPDGRREHAVVTGDLTVRDVTRPVRCPVRLRELDPGNDDDPNANLTGRVSVSRTEFGLGTDRDLRRGGILLGEHLVLDLDIRASRPRVPLRHRPGGRTGRLATDASPARSDHHDLHGDGS
jgi:polyisoprenoid-binding protein YceI